MSFFFRNWKNLVKGKPSTRSKRNFYQDKNENINKEEDENENENEVEDEDHEYDEDDDDNEDGESHSHDDDDGDDDDDDDDDDAIENENLSSDSKEAGTDIPTQNNTLVVDSLVDLTTLNSSVNIIPERLEVWSSDFQSKIDNQGGSSTCWAFATVGCVEAYLRKQRKLEMKLSVQELIDLCYIEKKKNTDANEDEKKDEGSSSIIHALDYITNHGILFDVDHPFAGDDQNILERKIDKSYLTPMFRRVHPLKGYKEVDTIEEIEAIVRSGDTVLVGVEIDELFEFLNPSEIYADPPDSDSKVSRHVLLIVGFGYEINDHGEKKKYWIVKNTYGDDWGADGYFRVEYTRGSNWKYYVPILSDKTIVC